MQKHITSLRAWLMRDPHRPHRPRRRRPAVSLGVGLFVLAVWLPLLCGIGRFGQAACGTEHPLAYARAQVAGWIRAEVANPRRLTWNFKYTFPLREALVHAHGLLKLRGFGMSASPRVFAGREGWLFLARENLDHTLPDRPFNAAELEAWARVLEARAAWLRSQGIAYLVVVAPDKHTAYADKLPALIGGRGKESRLDQWVRDQGTRGRVPILDLRGPLKAAREQADTYLRTDTHWNDWGARAAATAMVGRARTMLNRPTLAQGPVVPGSPEIVAGGDLADFLGLGGELQDRDWPPGPEADAAVRYDAGAGLVRNTRVVRSVVSSHHPDATLPRLVMFRDSFGTALIPFLAPQFSRAVFLWSYEMDTARVLAERPDLVIQEMVERQLNEPVPDAFIPVKDDAHPPAGR